jgi:rare lipoprotein A
MLQRRREQDPAAGHHSAGTNLENGQSANVSVQDRGPRAPGRIADATPKGANDLGMCQQGVTPIEVALIGVPQPDGGIRHSVGAEGGDAGLR